jgi:hypothetical protein
MEKYLIGFKYGLPNIIGHFLSMQKIKEFYHSIPYYKEKEEELRLIEKHQTRPPTWLRNQAFVIWSGNRGYFDIFSKKAMEIAIAYTIAFYAADLKDELCDDYLIPILCKKKFWNYDEKKILKILLNTRLIEINKKISKRAILIENASSNLLKLTSSIFKSLSKETGLLYERGMLEAFKGQALDAWVSVRLKTNRFSEIEKKFCGERYIEKIREIAEKKLGCIGEYAARITYRLSGGNEKKIENALCNWYKNATTLLQIVYDDVREVFEDLKQRNTNPLVLAMICKGYRELDKNELKKFIKENPNLINEMTLPLLKEMENNLNKLSEFNFDDHSLATKMIIKIVDKEIKNFEEKLSLI